MRAQAVGFCCQGMVDRSVEEMGRVISEIENMKRVGQGSCIYVFHTRGLASFRIKSVSTRCTDMAICSDLPDSTIF